MKHDDLATGWSFECPTDAGGLPPAGGLVLKDVKNYEHNFAKDIRVIGLWLEIEQVDAKGVVKPTIKKLRTLESSMFFNVGKIRKLEPLGNTYPDDWVPPNTAGDARPPMRAFKYLKEVDDCLYFSNYFKKPKGNYIAYGVAAEFDAPDLFAKLGYENCEYAGLTVEQMFLFSFYTNEPRHEPSGGLSAARFHPLVHYRLSKNPNFDAKREHTRLRSIRFDYRLHLLLDRHHDLATNAKLTQLGNEAGLFADQESAGKTAVKIGAGKLFGLGGGRHTVSSSVFASAEKPLMLEVIAPGLVKGFPRTIYLAPNEPESKTQHRCWDNIHWWGRRYEAGKSPDLPSTPGAFHCAHIHWRWGAAAQAAVSGPPFNPDTWPDSFGSRARVKDFSPLVDPRIFAQSISVAVTRNEEQLDPAKARLVDLTEDDWATLFDPGLRAKPLHLHLADIVLWYSSKVHREVTLASDYFANEEPGADNMKPSSITHVFPMDSEGTVFLHGIFFAHDAEPGGTGVFSLGRITNFTVGETGAIYTPKSWETIYKERKWLRWAG